jgi:hypothetical protein
MIALWRRLVGIIEITSNRIANAYIGIWSKADPVPWIASQPSVTAADTPLPFDLAAGRHEKDRSDQIDVSRRGGVSSMWRGGSNLDAGSVD